MALWTLFGLTSGKATTSWPAADGADGQEGVLGMPRYDPRLAATDVATAPKFARPMRSRLPAANSRSTTAAVSFANSASRPAQPARWQPSNDWAFGVRRREDLVWAKDAARQTSRDRRREACVPPQLARASCRRRVMQRLRIGAASPEQSVLQSAPSGHLFHAVAALCRFAVGDRSGHPRHARTAANGLRRHAGAALGHGGRHMRRIGRNSPGGTTLAGRALKAFFRSTSIFPAVRPILPRSSTPC